MTRVRVLLARARGLLRIGRREAELSEEIREHLDLLAQEHVRRGLSPDEARVAARCDFGGVDQIKEAYREQRGLPLVETIAHDFAYACRTLRKSPGFAVAAVLSLSVGMGMNSAIFTALDAVMFRSLPVPEPQTLFAVAAPGSGAPTRFSYPVFEQLRQAAPPGTGLAAASAIAPLWGHVDGSDAPRTIAVQLVSGEYFRVLGIAPAKGRVFLPEDNKTVDGHPVAVISHAFWLSAYDGNSDAIGRGLTLNGVHLSIVGVVPAGFSGVWSDTAVDMWVPAMMQAAVRYHQSYSGDHDANPLGPWIRQEGIRWLNVIGRSSPSADAVVEPLQTVYHQALLRDAEHVSDRDERGRLLEQRLSLQPLGSGFSTLRTRLALPLFALLGLAALVLLIACANTMNLLLARAWARRREFAIRLSLGAGRSRVVRQLLTESTLLVVVAGGIGLLLSRWTGEWLLRYAIGADGAVPFAVDVNTRVIVFTIATGVAAVLLVGIAPAFRLAGLDPGAALKASSVQYSRRPGLQKWLVGSQVALSLVLLVGAGLFVRTLQNYARVSLGFSPDRVVSVSISPVAAGYRPAQLLQLSRSLVARVQMVAGVTSASAAMCGLASGCRDTSAIAIDSYEPLAGEQMQVQENRVSAGYFSTVGMRIIEGREFDDHDLADAPKVAIVNRAMARRYFAGQSPIGHRVGKRRHDTEIVGVVADARVNGIQQDAAPMVFYPMAQGADPEVLEVRVAGQPGAVVADVRRAVAEVDANLPIDRVALLSEQVASGLREQRLVAVLTSIFGLVALALACVGLFGAMSYAVSRRTTEFGVRMALGARRSHVLRSVLGESLRVVAYGLAAGVPAALAVSAWLSSLLFGISPNDPLTIITAALLLATVAAAASVLPAWRAARTDPIVALRAE